MFRRFMRIWFIFAALAYAAASMPCAALAGNDNVLLKLARVLSYEKKYDESLKYYDEYLTSHPRDSKARLEAGDVAFWNKDKDRALKEYEEAKKDPKAADEASARIAEVYLAKGDYGVSEELYADLLRRDALDSKSRLKYARVLSYDKKYDDSLAQYDVLLKGDPKDLVALREKADVLSWARRYDESIDAYGVYLERDYDPDVARQRARVYGWAKQFDKSLAAYRDAYDRTDVSAIREEGEAKSAFWNGWVLTAMRRYRGLLESEPENIEARFDLGQVEGYERMWRQASEDFEKVQAVDKSHFRASDSLEKVRILSRDVALTPQFRWIRARSTIRDTHYDRLTAGAMMFAPLCQAVALKGGYAFDFFSFPGAASIPRQQGIIGLDVSFTPRVWANASYLPTGYTSDNRMSQLFDGSLSARPVDPIILTAFTRRDDLYNQRIVFDKQLRSTEIGGRVQANIHRRWVAFGDYMYNITNDTNRQNAFGVENLVYLMYEPKRLTVDLRLDFQNWKFTTTDYWSPSNFWGVSLTFHWRQYLNPDGMYFGAKNTYYGIKYKFQIDREKRPFNGGTVELYRDWTRHFSTGFEGFGIYSTVYNDAGVSANATIRF